MSAQEMNVLDDQVLEVANSSGAARKALEMEREDLEAERVAKISCDRAEEEAKRQREEHIARKRMQDLVKTLLRVVACLLAAGVFLALMLDPGFWVPVIGCVGILTFVVTAAISIERYRQRRRRYGV